ncbi:MAG: hypothetical protein ABR513_03610 [Desulfotignum sp.]
MNPQKKDGTLFYAAIAGNCFDFCGCRACCVSVREVDAPGHPEEKTGQNNELLDLIVNGFNGFIYTVSNDYKVEFINDALGQKVPWDTRLTPAESWTGRENRSMNRNTIIISCI